MEGPFISSTSSGDIPNSMRGWGVVGVGGGGGEGTLVDQ